MRLGLPLCVCLLPYVPGQLFCPDTSEQLSINGMNTCLYQTCMGWLSLAIPQGEKQCIIVESVCYQVERMALVNSLGWNVSLEILLYYTSMLHSCATERQRNLCSFV